MQLGCINEEQPVRGSAVSGGGGDGGMLDAE
jgi:hypothetical protein